MFEPPAGSFFVGYLDDEAVATGAWRRRADVEAFGSTADRRDQADVRRAAVARGGAGPGACWPTSRRPPLPAGAGRLVLETGLRQPEAIALYESSGYTPVPGFGYYRDAAAVPVLRQAALTPEGGYRQDRP